MKETQLVSVAIADAHFLIRLGLKSLLAQQSRFQVVAEVVDEAALLELLKTQTVDLLIMDYFQFPYFSKSTLDNVRAIAPSTKLILISSDENKENIYNTIQNGIDIYITKKCDEKEIADAINAALTGNKYFCKTALNFIIEKSFAKEDAQLETSLTQRELEIVRLIVKGLISKEIAQNLNIALHTVYTHRKNILRKLQLHSTSDLVRYASEQGLG